MSKLLTYGIMQQKRKANLILDDYGTGIAAAFSLRKLKSDYTGYCIELIRSSDGAMKNIGFVNGVVDTDEILSFLSVGEYGAVETW